MTEKKISFVVAYGPLVLFIGLTALTNFFPSLLDGVSINLLLALSGLCLLGIGFYLQERFRELESKYDATSTSVAGLEITQQAFIQASKRSIMPCSLATGFAKKALAGRRVGLLRIYAVSSQQILSFFSAENISAETVHLIIRGFDPNDAAHQQFSNQIHLVAKDWERLARKASIKSLIIRSYDHFPTEYQVIFDETVALVGLYESSPADYSEVAVRDPVYVDGSTPDGSALVRSYVERFDNLFEQCRNHHGINQYDRYCVPPLSDSSTNILPTK